MPDRTSVNHAAVLGDRRVRRARITAIREAMATNHAGDLQTIIEQAQAEAVRVALDGKGQ